MENITCLREECKYHLGKCILSYPPSIFIDKKGNAACKSFELPRGTIKDEPLPIYFLLRALADHTGLDPYIAFETPDYHIAKAENGKIKGIIVRDAEKEIVLQGSQTYAFGKAFLTNQGPILISDIVGKEKYTFIVKKLRSYKDYGVEVRDVGTTRDYEKGGWYTNIPIYEFNGKFYAPFECSSTMDSVYREQCNL